MPLVDNGLCFYDARGRLCILNFDDYDIIGFKTVNTSPIIKPFGTSSPLINGVDHLTAEKLKNITTNSNHMPKHNSRYYQDNY